MLLCMNNLKKINLLNTFSKVSRDIQSRKENKIFNRNLALKFDKEYFDGSRDQGYGGYKYDGRWVPVAHKLIDLFTLKEILLFSVTVEVDKNPPPSRLTKRSAVTNFIYLL